MGNIVSIRNRLQELERKQASARIHQSKAERDADFNAWLERLKAMSDDEIDAVEREQLAGIDASGDDQITRLIPKENLKASIQGFFGQIRWERRPALYGKPITLRPLRSRLVNHDGNDPTPPRAA